MEKGFAEKPLQQQYELNSMGSRYLTKEGESTEKKDER